MGEKKTLWQWWPLYSIIPCKDIGILYYGFREYHSLETGLQKQTKPCPLPGYNRTMFLCEKHGIELLIWTNKRVGFFWYSLIQTKCQGGNKYALPITVKFDQSTRRFGRISFARLLKLTKHIALLFHLLSPYLLSCMRGLRNVRKK